MKSPQTVLIVDDDPIMLVVLRRHLAPAGYQVSLARNQREVEESIAQNGPPDLVVMDVIMPDLDGRELGAQIRNGFPKTRILYVSGSHHPGLNDSLLRPYAGFLRKPFSADEFVQAVASLLRD